MRGKIESSVAWKVNQAGGPSCSSSDRVLLFVIYTALSHASDLVQKQTSMFTFVLVCQMSESRELLFVDFA